LSLRDLDVLLTFNYVFSLFRSETLEGAEARFSIYKDKVPVLVQIVREVIFFHILYKVMYFKEIVFLYYISSSFIQNLLISNIL